MVLRMRGGAKRRKTGDDDNNIASKSTIPVVLGEMNIKETDGIIVKNALPNDYDINEWLNTLSPKDAVDLKDVALKHESRGHSDYVIRTLAKYNPKLAGLEAYPFYSII
jgi:hypothetical protein